MKKTGLKKICNIVGLIASMALVLAGIVVLTGYFGEWTTSSVHTPSGEAFKTYDYGYAVFGADFYNYVTNNAGLAGFAAQSAAKNLSTIIELLRFGIGTFMICVGLCISGAFGIVLGNDIKKSKEALISPFITAAADSNIDSPQEIRPSEEKPADPEDEPVPEDEVFNNKGDQRLV